MTEKNKKPVQWDIPKEALTPQPVRYSPSANDELTEKNRVFQEYCSHLERLNHRQRLQIARMYEVNQELFESLEIAIPFLEDAETDYTYNTEKVKEKLAKIRASIEKAKKLKAKND